MKTAQQLVQEARANVQEISVQQLADIIQQQPDAVLIDIREPAEYQQGHITTAVNFPRGVLEMQLHNHPKVVTTGNDIQATLETLAEENIYLICRSGARTVLAAESLQRMGFCKVFSVTGGMLAWVEQHFPVQY